MLNITRVDFVPITTTDYARANAFYSDTLGLTETESTRDKDISEYDLGDTTLSVWNPADAGMPFAPNPNPVALHVEDVDAARTELEGKGVTFFGPTVDTGVCKIAMFNDPDGNGLMLHGRYAPRG